MKLERAWSPGVAHVLAKPTGAICNLACSYCYFLDKEAMYEGDHFRMSDTTLEAYITSLIEMHRTPEVSVAWQGGEPTLIGLDFFRRAIALQDTHRAPGMTFANTIQTNGTLLTDEWCEFLSANRFLVGISIDGPQPLHDAHRVNKRGEGSFTQVMRGVRLLQQHGVDFNVLTTVNRLNGDHPLTVYRFLRDEVGAEWIQFIPVVERVGAAGRPNPLEGRQVSERSVLPEQFGAFLRTVFDEWVSHDVGTVFIQTFEAAARNWAGLRQSGMCTFDATCGLGLALGHNGDLFSCDHFFDADHLLGNVNEVVDRRPRLEQSPVRVRPRQARRRCRSDASACDVRFACHGECPKNRFLTSPDGDPWLNYLCAGYLDFFHHIDGAMRAIVGLISSGRQAGEVMALFRDRDPDLRSGWARQSGLGRLRNVSARRVLRQRVAGDRVSVGTRATAHVAELATTTPAAECVGVA